MRLDKSLLIAIGLVWWAVGLLIETDPLISAGFVLLGIGLSVKKTRC